MKTYESEVEDALDYVKSQIIKARARKYRSSNISVNRFAYKQAIEYLKSNNFIYVPCYINNLISYWACGEDSYYEIEVYFS